LHYTTANGCQPNCIYQIYHIINTIENTEALVVASKDLV